MDFPRPPALTHLGGPFSASRLPSRLAYLGGPISALRRNSLPNLVTSNVNEFMEQVCCFWLFWSTPHDWFSLDGSVRTQFRYAYVIYMCVLCVYA